MDFKIGLYAELFVRSSLRLVRSQLSRSLVRTLGFKAGFCSDDLVATMRQCFYLARCGIPLIVAALDVATAFDAMDHGLLGGALVTRGVHPGLVRCLLRELSGFCGATELAGSWRHHVSRLRERMETRRSRSPR